MLYPAEKEKVSEIIAERVVIDNGSVCAYNGKQSISLWADNGIYVVKVVEGMLVITSPDE